MMVEPWPRLAATASNCGPPRLEETDEDFAPQYFRYSPWQLGPDHGKNSSRPAFGFRLILRLIFQGGVSQSLKLAHRTRRPRMKLGHKNGDHIFLGIDRE